MNKKVEERLIFFWIRKNINLIKNKICKEYFLDITFKIIPKIYKPYKLMTISGYNPETSILVAIIFVCIKHNYTISYIKIFEGEIIHTDYEMALEKEIIYKLLKN